MDTDVFREHICDFNSDADAYKITSLLKTSANYCINRTKIYDKLDDFTFPIINFPCILYYIISSNIPSTPAYISQCICYSRNCIQYSDFQDRTQLLTQNLLKQSYVDPRLKSLTQISTVFIRNWLTTAKYQFSFPLT
jgi:hypothetical protein